MPKSKRRKSARRTPHHDGRLPPVVFVQVEAIPKNNLPADGPDDRYVRYARPKWKPLPQREPADCDHQSTGCDDCFAGWAETHWLRIRPGPGRRWATVNNAPGLPTLESFGYTTERPGGGGIRLP